jgi:hypothetical protein
MPLWEKKFLSSCQKALTTVAVMHLSGRVLDYEHEALSSIPNTKRERERERERKGERKERKEERKEGRKEGRKEEGWGMAQAIEHLPIEYKTEFKEPNTTRRKKKKRRRRRRRKEDEEEKKKKKNNYQKDNVDFIQIKNFSSSKAIFQRVNGGPGLNPQNQRKTERENSIFPIKVLLFRIYKEFL